MKEYRSMPDIIQLDTPIVDLGNLNQERIMIDELIPRDKTSNHNIVYNGNWIKQDNTLLYFKVPITNSAFLKELLGVKVTEYFGLSSVQYQLAKASCIHSGEQQLFYGVVSKWARREDCSYTTLERVVKDNISFFKKCSNSYFAILDYIDNVYPNQPITHQMRKFIVREFFVQEKARLESEVLIEKNQNEINLGKLMDYEESWLNSEFKDYSIKRYLHFDPEQDSCLSIIQKDDVMQESLIKMMDMNILELLEEVKEEHHIRLIPYDIEYFKQHSDRIKQYVREKKLIR